MRLGAIIVAAVTLSSADPAAACRLTPVINGSIEFVPQKAPGEWLIKNTSMRGPGSFGALLGTLIKSREGIIVLASDGTRVGVIDPATGSIRGEDDDDCTTHLTIRAATPRAGLILNEDTPVGMYSGKLPR